MSIDYNDADIKYDNDAFKTFFKVNDNKQTSGFSFDSFNFETASQIIKEQQPKFDFGIEPKNEAKKVEQIQPKAKKQESFPKN